MNIWHKENPVHQQLISNYMLNSSVANNTTPKAMRLELYDGEAGVLFFITDELDSKIISVCSCVRYFEKGVESAKVWHRMEIPPGKSFMFIERFFEPATFNWCESKDLQNLWVTFNENQPRNAAWAAAKMGSSRSAKVDNPYCSAFGNRIRRAWRPHYRLIKERNVWQYLIYYSPNGEPFLEREEKPIDAEMESIFRRHFRELTT